MTYSDPQDPQFKPINESLDTVWGEFEHSRSRWLIWRKLWLTSGIFIDGGVIHFALPPEIQGRPHDADGRFICSLLASQMEQKKDAAHTADGSPSRRGLDEWGPQPGHPCWHCPQSGDRDQGEIGETTPREVADRASAALPPDTLRWFGLKIISKTAQTPLVWCRPDGSKSA
ncbi:hypothetical protein MHIB_30900 [Mycolicibacter hiberniae]|uniref:Uncharacterized protein n=1 Tax=Mycolicibacter hiberniae TaxID=29314 RepID=A0A7I7X5H1_9MYCO|nr:hypothetical protein MHIB_30900 [Mycolicibacter hiberniae]